ncbi:hypothetical protein NUW58_g2253 [Xylaria curta]|uniref:Uncharacterized protein n=1 Tax=Xylaria curta TaxID=42375 RepID=A0ACC1PHV0_9PEZI|nr:hypothetical protein NUW58_g2253 [Xylaria curta]
MKNDGISNLTRTMPAPGVPLDTKPPVSVSTKQQTVEVPSKLSQQWNTKNLGSRLGADIVSAACAASMIAPVISIIDRSIMENTSGRNTLAESLKTSLRTLVTRPHTILFSRPVALIFMLYGGTYLTANTLDTASSTMRSKPATYVSTGTDKFAASSAANVGLCIYKDQVYAKLLLGVVARAAGSGDTRDSLKERSMRVHRRCEEEDWELPRKRRKA